MRFEAEIAILMQDKTWKLEKVDFCTNKSVISDEEIIKLALEKFKSNTYNTKVLHNSGWSGVATVYSFKRIMSKEKVIKIPCYDIVVTLDGEGHGTITSSLHDNNTVMTEEDVQYHAAIDALESIIMAHAVAGVNIESYAYLEGIEIALNAIGQNFCTS